MKFMDSKHKHTSVCPTLTKIIELIAAKRPLLEYEVVEIDNEKRAHAVKVYQHGQCLGYLNTWFHRYSNKHSRTEIWIALKSWTIQRDRGEPNTKYTKDPKVAASIVIDKFTKKSFALIAHEVVRETTQIITGIHDRVHGAFRYSMEIPQTFTMAYFIKIKQGEQPKVPQNILDKISDEVVRKYENYKIAGNVLQHMKSKNGTFVTTMKDGALLCIPLSDPDRAERYENTYALPDFMQEKLTMLKLLDHAQFAADIGIKIQHDSENLPTFFVVSGDTVVH